MAGGEIGEPGPPLIHKGKMREEKTVSCPWPDARHRNRIYESACKECSRRPSCRPGVKEGNHDRDQHRQAVLRRDRSDDGRGHLRIHAGVNPGQL